MKPVMMIAVAASALLAACQTLPRDTTVAEYCANPSNGYKDVCRLKVEIDGNSTALSQTDMRLSEAYALIDKSQRTANTALLKADDAQAAADRAQARADAAYSRSLSPDDMVCETRTIQKTNIGTCRPGYTLMSCTQSRFTYRAGGPSILREINDEQCRFHDRVLEMKVRCCALASASPQPINTVIDRGQPETYPPRQTEEATPYRY